MSISDKEAYRILGLPLGVDRDAINARYRASTNTLASSKLPEDIKRLERIVEAYHQLIPPNQRQRTVNPLQGGKSSHRANDDAANISAMHALQRKAEKKKEKKKRKKEKRKNNDKSEKFISNNGIIKEESDCSSLEQEIEEDNTDNNGTYISGNHRSNHNTENGAYSGRPSEANEEVLQSHQMQARSLAVRGNEAAAEGAFNRAIKLFTSAFHYDQRDHRYLGNRSFCYEQIKDFDKALADADKAIEMNNCWPKGHFRRGKALTGLGKLTVAEEAFQRVLELDPSCAEAHQEIHSVRMLRLEEMGFTLDQARAAIAKYKYVQTALDALLSGEFQEVVSNVYNTDGDSDSENQAEARVLIPASSLVKKTSNSEDMKMNPKNPQGLTSLWVGNVLPEVTEKELQKLFLKHGQVSSVRQLKEKFCAFVNFTDSGSAGRAMNKLQGHPVHGQRLLIKFPDNPITCTTAGGARRRTLTTTTPSKHDSSDASSMSPGSSSSGSPSETSAAKAKGPVDGDECYFWRTTGCIFLDFCRHKHVEEHKGIDKKPWQK